MFGDTNPILTSVFDQPAFAAVGDGTTEKWFAVHTYSRREKVVAQEARDLGVTIFLPTVKEVRKWTDRRKVIESPLFSCYVFVKIVPDNRERLKVLRINGVWDSLELTEWAFLFRTSRFKQCRSSPKNSFRCVHILFSRLANAYVFDRVP